MTDYLRKGLQNYAWVACLLGDALAARKALGESAPLCLTTEARWQQKLGEAHLYAVSHTDSAGLPVEVARLGALDLCRVIYEHQRDELPEEVRSQAYWLSGTLLLLGGDSIGAETMARLALDSAARVEHDCRCLYDAADLLRAARLGLKAAPGAR